MYNRAANMMSSKWAKLGAVVAPSVGLLGAAAASGDVAMPPQYPWEHRARFTSYDHASMRRGYQVYKEVCAACHSMERICYRHLTGITHTQEQAKVEAEGVLVDDIDDKGNFIQRPGKLTDHFPSPYLNENAGRAANNGALPPDLSLIAKARDGGADYIFALLVGYGREPPAGFSLAPGQYFNPWFPGGGLAMPQPIYDEHVEYEDGTPATMPQMAKDVCEFLVWAGEPNADEKAMWAFNLFIALAFTFGCCLWGKRFEWNYLKTQKIIYKGPQKVVP